MTSRTGRVSRQNIRVLPGGTATELEEAICDYLTAVDARTRNPRTREFYEYGLQKVLQPFCRDESIERLDQLDQRAIDRLAASLNARRKADGQPLSAASVAAYLRSVRQFIKWAGARVPDVAVPRPVVPKRDLRDQVLSREEMAALVEAAATIRDRVLIELLCTTGLRLGEALALSSDDLVDRGRAGRFVVVRHRSRGGGAKGDSSREVPVRPALYAALKQLGTRRPADCLSDRLFITNRRRPNGEYAALAVRTVENMLKATAARAGIARRVHPHLLRHSFATEFMRAKRDPVTLQKILGHADLSMIANVYDHPSSADLYAVMLDFLRDQE